MSLNPEMSTRHMGYMWITEWISPKEAHMHGLEKIYFEGRTKYQHVVIAKTFAFGDALFLDGYVQSTEADEFIYHEALVHPAMLAHPSPRRVAVIGGGEGATLREVLRHPTVERAVMVDIDGELIELVKKYMEKWHRGSFDDPRVELRIEDGRRFLEEAEPGSFDVIVLDLTDPAEGTPGVKLYTKEFYQAVYRALSPDGVAVTQATSTRYNLFMYAIIRNTMASVFPHVRPYKAFIPAFLSEWGFMLASKSRDPVLPLEEVERRLPSGLRFLDAETYKCLFTLPKHVKEALESEKRISTDANPATIY